ncbi:MAG: flavodoxin family protein [Desulfohalobiaceae bacterium]|nr:flavodoxin family protein [Desulfohalobiaceae bacterium]
MYPQVIGVSGSPVENSNTDRLVRAVLEASGLEYEFVKLSQLTIRPCMACLGCTGDNVCKVKDDFPELAENLKMAHGLVIGSYPPYASMDGFSKAFLERLFSMRHQKHLNKGKLAVVVTTGIGGEAPGLMEASQQVSAALQMEGMEVLGRLRAAGNVPCLVCGHGEECPISALPWLFGEETKITSDKFCRIENQDKVLIQARELGQTLARRIREQTVKG